MGTANYEGASGPAFEPYQMYPYDVGTFFATSKSVECPTYTGLVGETKYWEEEKCTADERIYSAEGEDDEDAEQHELQIALALSKEDPQVEELATRCNDFDTTPHVPRVNGEIPQESSSDAKQRLADRLSKCGLSENIMEGDGNCQFRALSDQLFETPDKHMFVRRRVVWQLTTHQNRYSEYVPMEYSQYLENMARDGEWGDHVSLQAAADLFGTKITLITSFKDTCKIEIIPAQQKFDRGIYLSFWSEIHYNSIYPLGVM